VREFRGRKIFFGSKEPGGAPRRRDRV